MPKLVFKNLPGPWHVGGHNEFPRVTLTQVSWDTSPHKAEAFVFFGYPQVDMDGLPDAYGPHGIPGINPRESIADAGNAQDGWFGVVGMTLNDPAVLRGDALLDQTASKFNHEFPVVQQTKNGDPNPGYYVSSTPRRLGDRWLQNSYTNPGKIPFGALDGALSDRGVDYGDVGLAIRHDKNLQCPFFFLDPGPTGWSKTTRNWVKMHPNAPKPARGATGYGLGECSLRVCTDLGGVFTTRRAFNNNFPVSFIVFPSSGRLIPGSLGVPDQVIENNVEQQLFPLSRASNAVDLILLMGFNEVPPRHTPQGIQKLDHFNKVLGSPMPRHYGTIMNGLFSYGFQPHQPVMKANTFSKAELKELGL